MMMTMMIVIILLACDDNRYAVDNDDVSFVLNYLYVPYYRYVLLYYIICFFLS